MRQALTKVEALKNKRALQANLLPLDAELARTFINSSDSCVFLLHLFCSERRPYERQTDNDDRSLLGSAFRSLESPKASKDAPCQLCTLAHLRRHHQKLQLRCARVHSSHQSGMSSVISRQGHRIPFHNKKFLLHSQIIEEFQSLAARFGPSLPPNGFRVLAVGAEPAEACEPIAEAPKANYTSQGTTPKFVAVIVRGSCSFAGNFQV